MTQNENSSLVSSNLQAPSEQGLKGRVITAYGQHYEVEMEDGTLQRCQVRNKKKGGLTASAPVAVGDWVNVVVHPNNPSIILDIWPRRNLLYRSDNLRTKQFAANIDCLFIIVAVAPTFSEDWIGRALIAARSVDIKPYLVLNKIDITQGLTQAQARVQGFAELGVPVLEISALDTKQTRKTLYPYLENQVSLLLGQSGMGKSTVLNALVVGANALTRAHSLSRNTGRHTTTTTRLYPLSREEGEMAEKEKAGAIIDSPGFQTFGLHHLSQEAIIKGFPEFTPYASHCRFYNCSHQHEPGCRVLAALSTGAISSARHALYKRILAENAVVPY